MSSDEEGDLVAAAKPPADPTSALLRSKVRRKLLGIDTAKTRFGRYRLLDQVGAGAMGTVYAAYDPVLDRRVALKVLRTRGSEGRQRVLREARALAKLTHPHVVTVYEADEVDDTVYIAMEFVDGPNLRAWLKTGSKEVDALLRVFVAAGDGLAAAHDADLTHSDFKPENLLLGKERVCVADFGVAYSGRPEQESYGGTLSYMAPEQLSGEAPTARSDQFSFCVTLFEAFTGERPFAGDTKEALLEAMSTAPDGSRLPAAVRPHILRGLERDPNSRHPGMRGLIGQIRPRQVQRSLLLPLSIFAILLSCIVLILLSNTDPCDGGATIAQQVWTSVEQDALRTQARAVNAAYGPPAATRIQSTLEQYKKTWTKRHRDVCEATRVHGTQSDSAYDARMTCLERRLLKTRALTSALLSASTTKELAKGVAATASLEAELSRCDHPEKATKSDAESQKLTDESWALYRLGRYKEALARAEQSVSEARSQKDPGLRAEALFALAAIRARTQPRAKSEATLKEALLEAARAERDALSAEIWLWVIRGRLFQGAYRDVIDWSTFAKSAAVRGHLTGGAVEGVVGEAYLRLGDYKAAERSLTSAITAEKNGRPDRLAVMYTNLGSTKLRMGAVLAADHLYEEALSTIRVHLGDSHPGVAFYLEKLGRSRRARGDLSEARTLCERAAQIRTAAYGPDDRAVATSALCLADVLLDMKEIDSAEANLLRAQKIRLEVYGASHPSLARVHSAYGELFLQKDDPTSAKTAFHEAIALLEATAKNHPELASLYARLAVADPDQTALHLGRAETIARSISGTQLPLLEVRIAEHRWARATKNVKKERALAASVEQLMRAMSLPVRHPLQRRFRAD